MYTGQGLAFLGCKKEVSMISGWLGSLGFPFLHFLYPGIKADPTQSHCRDVWTYQGINVNLAWLKSTHVLLLKSLMIIVVTVVPIHV